MIEAPLARVASRPGVRLRGAVRRSAIVDAAVDLLLEGGPAELTHRRIALRAGVPLAATTYYFDSLGALVAEAGRVLVDRWAAHAEAVGARAGGAMVPDERARLLVDAILPEGNQTAIRGHYEHLAGSGRGLGAGGARGSDRSGLTAAVGAIIDRLSLRISPTIAIAMVDGAAISALSEGLDVRETATDLLRATLCTPALRA